MRGCSWLEITQQSMNIALCLPEFSVAYTFPFANRPSQKGHVSCGLHEEWIELALLLGGVGLRRRQGERERGSAVGGPCCFCCLVLILKHLKYKASAKIQKIAFSFNTQSSLSFVEPLMVLLNNCVTLFLTKMASIEG